jgi:hypothetical protein
MDFPLKSYNPELTSDPFAEDGCLWFFNFFIYNRKLKRIIFFSCRCNSKTIHSDSDDDEESLNDRYMLTDDYKPTGKMSINVTNILGSTNNNNDKSSKPIDTLIGYFLFFFFFYLINS